ncbi:MAG: hypothetical protein QXK69_08375 [Candidatus Caldarchaeum sp.]
MADIPQLRKPQNKALTRNLQLGKTSLSLIKRVYSYPNSYLRE